MQFGVLGDQVNEKAIDHKEEAGRAAPTKRAKPANQMQGAF